MIRKSVQPQQNAHVLWLEFSCELFFPVKSQTTLVPVYVAYSGNVEILWNSNGGIIEHNEVEWMD